MEDHPYLCPGGLLPCFLPVAVLRAGLFWAFLWAANLSSNLVLGRCLVWGLT